MTLSRRIALRDLMVLAWRKFRFERGGATFAAALRHAWAWFKGEAARDAAAERYRSASQHQHLRVCSMLKSPIRRGLTGKTYAGRRAWEAGALTTRLGV
jgi:hypothetical protein